MNCIYFFIFLVLLIFIVIFAFIFKKKTMNESFTSKTCSSCGSRYNIGSSKTYNCSNCKTTMDRDINAAKNIFIIPLINI